MVRFSFLFIKAKLRFQIQVSFDNMYVLINQCVNVTAISMHTIKDRQGSGRRPFASVRDLFFKAM